MPNIKVVVGANFGDEGKGLMTDYFCHQSIKNKQSCIVVLSNGGAQRGHTVNLLDGTKHTFKHFGSGTLTGAHTYCVKEFILNPMQFVVELDELRKLGVTPVVYVDSRCRWSTPFDMICNHIIEETREIHKHGSCGMGIWETVNRWDLKQDISIATFNRLPYQTKVEHLMLLRDVWLRSRLKDYGVSAIPEKWLSIVNAPGLINHFIDDVALFCSYVHFVSPLILQNYDTVVYENGQGLLLSEEMSFMYGNNTTPSNTGIYNAYNNISQTFDKNSNIEFCFVTRTYMTRHGAGKFVTECDKSYINKDMFDENNLTNEFQDQLRYGELDISQLKKRIENNLRTAESSRIPYTTTVAVTHTNEYEFDYSELRNNIINNVYVSNSKTRDSVKLFDATLCGE